MNNSLEKIVLIVDDQYGQADDPMIPERYGNGKVPGYIFELEDAFDQRTKSYSAQKVVARVIALKPSIVLLDMEYGYKQTVKGFGQIIMKELQSNVPEIPVLIHSSEDSQAGLARIKECIEKYGAKASIPKCPSCENLKKYLDQYSGETSK